MSTVFPLWSRCLRTLRVFSCLARYQVSDRGCVIQSSGCSGLDNKRPAVKFSASKAPKAHFLCIFRYHPPSCSGAPVLSGGKLFPATFPPTFSARVGRPIGGIPSVFLEHRRRRWLSPGVVPWRAAAASVPLHLAAAVWLDLFLDRRDACQAVGGNRGSNQSRL